MPRIEVLVERIKNAGEDEVDYEGMGISRPSHKREYLWRRKSIYSEEIYSFEELDEQVIKLFMNNGETLIVQCPYDEFDVLISLLEGDIEFLEEEEGEQDIEEEIEQPEETN